MGNSQLDLQLSSLLRSLTHTLLLLYELYTPQIKTIALILLAYLAYKTGRITIVDPLEQKIKHIQSAINNQSFYGVLIPNRMQNARKFRKILVIIFVIAALLLTSVHFIQPQLIANINIQILLAPFGIVMALIIFVWVHEAILGWRMKRGSFNHHQQQRELADMVKTMGLKTQSLIKVHMCREMYKQKAKEPAGVCNKTKCQQQRQVWKEKAQNISNFIDNTINFEWCSQCRKRLPFDQFLSFQAQFFEARLEGNEQEEVAEKNIYLMKELNRMLKWVKQLVPCNCSVRYWVDSTQQIKVFKAREKEFDLRIKDIENMRNQVKQ